VFADLGMPDPESELAKATVAATIIAQNCFLTALCWTRRSWNKSGEVGFNAGGLNFGSSNFCVAAANSMVVSSDQRFRLIFIKVSCIRQSSKCNPSSLEIYRESFAPKEIQSKQAVNRRVWR